MKKSKLILLVCLSLFIGCTLQGQTFTETLKEEASFSGNNKGNSLVVYNVSGSVDVKGYEGSVVKIEVAKKIKGHTKRALEQGKTEIGIRVEKSGNVIYVYHDSPYTTFSSDTGRFSHNQNWNNTKYNYTMDYTILVPNKASLELSTINNGHLNVDDVDAEEISVSNINGGITMTNISGKTYANALNSDIEISYAENPSADSTYKSLNGDINITVQENLNAQVSFKSLNGDIYTNFDTTSSPDKMELRKKKGKRGTRYKVDKGTKFQIGSGGIRMDFDVLNGNVTIKS